LNNNTVPRHQKTGGAHGRAVQMLLSPRYTWDHARPIFRNFSTRFSRQFAPCLVKVNFRGLRVLSSASQLNLSALYGTGGACSDCVAHFEGVLGGV
jgi:hypothetical protein